MTSSILPLLLPAVVVAMGLAVFLPVPMDLTGRFLQHLLSPAVQILAASSAAILLRQAAAGYGPRDHERRAFPRPAPRPHQMLVLVGTKRPLIRSKGMAAHCLSGC